MLDDHLHEHQLLRYRVEIINEAIRDSDTTALIHFFDQNDKPVNSVRYPVIASDRLFDMIRRGEELHLGSCYIKDFSLKAFRSRFGLAEHERVELRNFSARKAFFDCDSETDFSYATFTGNKAGFEGVVFANGELSFFASEFRTAEACFKRVKLGAGNTTFKSCKFLCEAVTFQNANFGTGALCFVDAQFSEGTVSFGGCFFGEGHVDFKFARFGNGEISFEKAAFGKGRKDFKNVEFGGGRLDFRRVDFNDGDVLFEGVEFGNGKVNFRSCRFGHGRKSFHLADFAQGEAQFDYTDFGTGELSFNKTRVSDMSFSGCRLNCYTDLRVSECHEIDLSNTIIRDILDVKPEDDRVVIRELNLAGMRILGRIFIDWRANNVSGMIHAQKRPLCSRRLNNSGY